MSNDALKINKNGHIHVKNLSAYWIPELTAAEVIAGTLYTVTGSYEGTGELSAQVGAHYHQKFCRKAGGF